MANGNRISSNIDALAAASTPDVYELGPALDRLGRDAGTNLVKKASQGVWTTASSGFGKGALITAAVIIGGAALTMGGIAYAGMANYFYPAGSALAPLMSGEMVEMTFAQGLWEGAKVGATSLFNGFGLTSLALGGMVGAVADVRAHQNGLEAEIATERARSREALRGLAQLRANSVEPAKQSETPAQEQGQETARFRDEFAPRCVDTVPEVSYCTRELERRAKQSQERGLA